MLLALCACSAVVCVPKSGRNKRQQQQQVLPGIPVEELAYTRQGEAQHTHTHVRYEKCPNGETGECFPVKAVQVQCNLQSENLMQRYK